ncbi:MAG: DEAD/DEAH box helicase [Candidatus Gracilibacteria bacterium]|nr:DEAD/DEAH box helicase [Candidatus Gracilibacteria bacterium]MDD2908126.1 DEAD/DEAH box helicase [Candidatus Gracilibacteria bacterium]
MNFTELNLRPEVLAGIKKLGYETPTKIQEEVIRESAEGKNIIGQSQTGTGKTGAFVISLLEKIDLTKPGIQALILAPTRELVTQIRDEILSLSTDMYVKSLPVYGGSPIGKQIEMLRKGQTIVVGTPGRVIDLIERGALRVKEVSMFILDECDRMLDMGFVDDIDFIWGNMTSIDQTMAFSATITSELKSIIEKYLGLDYTFIKATDNLMVDKINHSFTEIPHIEKYDALKKTIIVNKSKKTIVFVQTKRDTEMLAKKLFKDGFNADCLNGDMRQRERFQALKDFQEGVTDIFVVTDVAARGLNVKNIELVVNFDVPSDPESYIHRIGRTGRAGAEGTAVMFVASDEKFAFKNIERRNKITIKQTDEEGNEVARQKEERSFGGRSGGSRFGGRSSGGSSRGPSRGGSSSRGGYRGDRFGSDSESSERKTFSDSPRGDRPERKTFSNDEKRASFNRDDGASRPKSGYFEKKEAAGFGGERKSFGDSPRGDRSFGDKKPFGDRKSFGDRPERSFGGERKSFGDSPRGDRSFGDKKPFGDRKSFGDRPERSFGGERKSFGDSPRGDRSFGDKKPFGDRKSFGDRPERSFDKPKFDGAKKEFSEKKPRAKKED